MYFHRLPSPVLLVYLVVIAITVLPVCAAPAPLSLDHLPDLSPWHNCGSPLTSGYTERHFDRVEAGNKIPHWYAVAYYSSESVAVPTFVVVVYVELNGQPQQLNALEYTFDASTSAISGTGPPVLDTGGQGKALWATDSDIFKHFVGWMRSRDNPPSHVLVPGYALGNNNFRLVTGLPYQWL